MLAAAHGCKVVAVDPQPLCIRLLGAAANRSGLARSMELHNSVIAPDAMHSGAMLVPTDQCHGTAEFKAAKQEVSDVTREGRGYIHRRTRRVAVAPISMDALIGACTHDGPPPSPRTACDSLRTPLPAIAHPSWSPA